MTFSTSPVDRHIAGYPVAFENSTNPQLWKVGSPLSQDGGGMIYLICSLGEFMKIFHTNKIKIRSCLSRLVWVTNLSKAGLVRVWQHDRHDQQVHLTGVFNAESLRFENQSHVIPLKMIYHASIYISVYNSTPSLAPHLLRFYWSATIPWLRSGNQTTETEDIRRSYITESAASWMFSDVQVLVAMRNTQFAICCKECIRFKQFQTNHKMIIAK